MGEPVIPLDEFDREMEATRRLIERVPTEKGEWKPHERSFPLGHLAQLTTWLAAWVGLTLRDTDFDFAEHDFRYTFEPTDKLLAMLDEGASSSREALQEVTGHDPLDATWTLRSGDVVLYSASRRTAARMHLSHLIHHRAQLTVYLRLLGIPVPAIYGPSADER